MNKSVEFAFLLFAVGAASQLMYAAELERGIQEQIDATAANGGGKVVVPAGRHEAKGPIRLRSNVELHLEKDAVVVFPARLEAYLPAVRSSWAGIECMNFSPLVYAFGCTNVAITGDGELRAFEGRYEDTVWGKLHGERKKLEEARQTLYGWGEDDFQPERREIWRSGVTRPQFVQFNRCCGVRIEGVRIRNSPFWTIHLLLCDGVEVRDIDVAGKAWSNDGLDIEMSRNVLVERCRFAQGDDAIILKSGRNRDGIRVGRPTENVEIRDCHFEKAYCFFGCGSEISAGVRNVRVHDCTVGRTGYLCHVKTNRRRGGFVENITFENVWAGKANSVLCVDTDAMAWPGCPELEPRITRISGISLRNVRVGEADVRVDVQGDARLPVSGITLENVIAGAVSAPDHYVNATDVTDDGRRIPSAGVFRIADYGDDIQAAVDAAAATGCGCVVVPDGEWTTDPVSLGSGVELFLSPATRLIVRTGDGKKPLIGAENADGVTISGYGQILAEESGKRSPSVNPPLVGFKSCNGVRIKNTALRNTPSDTVLAVEDTGRMLVSGVEFIAQVPEDGFVRVADSDVRLKECSLRVGDGWLSVHDPSHRTVARGYSCDFRKKIQPVQCHGAR